ncbi:serine hydrolase domain-containing protein [Glycomyces tenuis]|uniref:serine hydrolase domain-containing protein n=1 Tax=Glycomyces tenuis TaxID=58116 RepID=UPI000412C02F|nr:serine hydrolase domain-containing protein [Glycomyces tenuis]
MHSIHRRTAAVIGAFASLAVTTAACTATDDLEGDSSSLQSAVEAAHEEGGFVSVSAEVRDGEHYDSAGAGVADVITDEPVPEEGHFRAGSVTKTFIATLLLQLEAEGEVAIDDSVERWLPGLISGNGYDGSAITLRNLLQHTSGLPNYSTVKDFDMTATAFENERWTHYDPEDLVAIALAEEPLFPPAGPDEPEPTWAYSNTNYVVAGMVIEEVTGNDWRQELQERILDPLGMEDTFAPGDDPRVPEPHAKTYKKFPEDRSTWVDTTVRNPSSLDAAAELITTKRDLDTFMTALLGGELLPDEQLEKMQQTVPVDDAMQQMMPGAEYGLSLLRQPLSCGGEQWDLGGQVVGGDTLVAQTADGGKGVVVSATGMAGPEEIMQGGQALQHLVDQALCGQEQ